MKTANDSGLSLIANTGEIIHRTNIDSKVIDLSSIFYLNDIRVYASHKINKDIEEKYKKALNFFDIDEEEMNTIGWGKAVDMTYDKIIIDQNKVLHIIKECISEISTV